MAKSLKTSQSTTSFSFRNISPVFLLNNQAMFCKVFIKNRFFKIVLEINSFDFANFRKRYTFHIGVIFRCVKLANDCVKTIE